MACDNTRLTVEVVYALAGEQTLLHVVLPLGSTIQDAIEHSGIVRIHPEIKLGACDVGVFGRRRTLNALLKDGDRVEIYRSLIADPKDRRRALARRHQAASKRP